MKMFTNRRGTVLAFALAAWMGPRGAFAQERSPSDLAQAREFLNQGKALLSQGDNAGALEKLKAAHALANTPITGIELGRARVLAGQLVEAEEAFLSVARIPVRPEETSRSTQARRESAVLAEQVRSRIPTLEVRVTGVPTDSVAVTIDGAVMLKEALAGPRLVNPGHHVVSAKSTTGGTAETTVDLKEGEARDVELKIVFTGGSTAAPPSAPVQQAEPQSVSPAAKAEDNGAPRSHLLDWSLMGGGAAVATAGVVLLIVESHQTEVADNNHDRSAYDSAITGWRVGLVGTILGAAAVTGGVVLFALSSRSNGSAAGGSLWIAGQTNGLRVGGTW